MGALPKQRITRHRQGNRRRHDYIQHVAGAGGLQHLRRAARGPSRLPDVRVLPRAPGDRHRRASAPCRIAGRRQARETAPSHVQGRRERLPFGVAREPRFGPHSGILLTRGPHAGRWRLPAKTGSTGNDNAQRGDHRLGHGRPGAGADQRRPGAHGRDLGRVDHHPHRHQGATHRRSGRQHHLPLGHRGPPGARHGGSHRRGHRPHRRRHLHPRSVPRLPGLSRPGGAGRQCRRLRSRRRLLRFRLRAGRRLAIRAVRPARPGDGHRRRHPDPLRRLHRSLDLHPLRRRRGRGRSWRPPTSRAASSRPSSARTAPATSTSTSPAGVPSSRSRPSSFPSTGRTCT